MSQSVPNPPVPPLPPPVFRLNSSSSNLVKESPAVCSIQVSNNECSWAAEFPEVQKGCFLGRVCQYTQPQKCRYYKIASILQEGPTCGLTALSMLLHGHPPASELLLDATAQKYTMNGEMFSAQYFYELTQKHLKSEFVCQFHKGVLDCDRIKEYLIAGACLLVPYPFSTNKINVFHPS